MANLTISMSDELIRQVRIEAAKEGKSMSRYVADSLERQIREPTQSEERRRERLKKLRKVFDGPLLQISENGRMPTAEERNARR